MTPKIAFISAVCPAQYSQLADYLGTSGLADTFYLTTPGNLKANQHRYNNLVGFDIDGKLDKINGYYYSSKTERSARIGVGVFRRLKELLKTKKIDLIVAHALWGAPYFVYDEIDLPVVSYMEFPSYRCHGWDQRYPPDLGQRLTDKNMEMVQIYQLLRSDLTIVPSEYAKSLFPQVFHHKIRVQFEGFDVEPPMPVALDRTDFTIGFAARDLSSAKGFETFAAVCQSLKQQGSDIRCVALGSDKVSSYGYEQQYVERYYKDSNKGFTDLMREKYPDAGIELLGLLSYEEYARTLQTIDLFLYPLRHGVANWGLVEILFRGKAVIASNRCFVPEIIQDGKNGLLMDNPDDIEAWVKAIRILQENPALKERIEKGARSRAEQFHISSVAPRYMSLFQEAIESYARAGRSW